jgi:putative Ca2+/H+ antiporter (TMEM165/GDT1 family)
VTGWVEILTVAFVAQLAVLPGEKVQFIIAGLSTRYDPKVVVAAAGSAFAGWTVLEILFGQALKTALPPTLLDALTAGLFLLFAFFAADTTLAILTGFSFWETFVSVASGALVGLL